MLQAIVFVDLTGREEISSEILDRMKSVGEVKVIKPIAEGLTVDYVSYPPMLSGKRVLILRPPAYKALVKSIRQKLGEGYEAILYHIGFDLGRHYFKSHVDMAGGDFSKIPEIGEKLFRFVGFGILKFVRIDPLTKYCHARVWDSFECRLYEKASRPRSQFVRGMLAGWVSELFQTSVEAIETRCIAMGDPYCEFIIKKR